MKARPSTSANHRKSGVREIGPRQIATAHGPDVVNFADVRRACHRWLMQRDEPYRRENEARAVDKARREAKRTRPDL